MKKSTIFVIDDDSLILEMLKAVLSEDNSMDVISFLSGEDALLNLDLNPEIVVLDYYLNSVNNKAMNGLTVLKEIKKNLPSSKVIILSGQEDLEVVYKLNHYNADDYVVKDKNAVLNVKKIIDAIMQKR
jgi:DNA-binding NarL/FixJ family response regulator